MTLNRRAIRAWAMYDWANSVFSVTAMSAFFPLFLKQYWSSGHDATVSQPAALATVLQDPA